MMLYGENLKDSTKPAELIIKFNNVAGHKIKKYKIDRVSEHSQGTIKKRN